MGYFKWSQTQPYTICGNSLFLAGGNWPDFYLTYSEDEDIFLGCYSCESNGGTAYTMQRATNM